MSDQDLVEAGTLKNLPRPRRAERSALRHWLACLLVASRCLMRYLLEGRKRGIRGLADLAAGNIYFCAVQVPSELAALGEILKVLRPEHALEIGTARGGTLFFLTRLAAPNATIVTVDLPGGKFVKGYRYTARRQWIYRRFARAQQRVVPVQGNSHAGGTLRVVQEALENQPLDYLFIDGDHTYEGVKRDFEMYAPLVRRGGLIAFHDIAEGPPESVGGVPRFWAEVKSQYRHREIVEDPLQGGFGIGILYLE